MIFETTPIPDLFVCKPSVYQDTRGYFFESYHKEHFWNAGLTYHFVQDNQSFSTYGVIRALHYQRGSAAQAKLVRVAQGTVLDVAVDLRPQSPTFKKHFAIELSAVNKLQLLIPRGFAHGFSVLSETAELLYKCDNHYHKALEGGIVYNDKTLGIDWRVPLEDVLVSEKDLQLPNFENAILE